MFGRFSGESVMNRTLPFSLAAVLILGAGCTTSDPKSGKGFTLPEGDAERGKETFVQLQCTSCHTVSGLEFEKPENSSEKMVVLGGEKPKVTTYGELVTSIINPSHRFAAGYDEEEIKADSMSK
ncbi:MAG: hypothetical protein MI861_17065, partial [Pirellulales bacterium]|nr:hypothetical protein [Pirellulales bacterium]